MRKVKGPEKSPVHSSDMSDFEVFQKSFFTVQVLFLGGVTHGTPSSKVVGTSRFSPIVLMGNKKHGL